MIFYAALPAFNQRELYYIDGEDGEERTRDTTAREYAGIGSTDDVT